jgi:hypothetical protein
LRNIEECEAGARELADKIAGKRLLEPHNSELFAYCRAQRARSV